MGVIKTDARILQLSLNHTTVD